MTIYQFKVKGHLDRRIGDRFAGLSITKLPNGETVLTGPVIDQAALYGVLISIRDLGIPLLAVNRLSEHVEHKEVKFE